MEYERYMIQFDERIHWIIPGVLGGMSLPGAGEMALLAAHGVTGIISLTEEASHIGSAAHDAGLSWLHLPIDDFHAPSLEQIDDAVSFIGKEIDSGGSVVVHCFAGRGRTGTILAAYLVSTGFQPTEAVARIRGIQPGAIETREQEHRISEYYFERVYIQSD